MGLSNKEKDKLNEFMQTARGKNYSQSNIESLCLMATTSEAVDFFGSYYNSYTALLMLCKQCKTGGECLEEFYGILNGEV